MNMYLDWIARARARIVVPAALMALAVLPAAARAQTVVQAPRVRVQAPATTVQVPSVTVQVPPRDLQLDARQLEIAARTLADLGQRWDTTIAPFDTGTLDFDLAEWQSGQGIGRGTGFAFSSQDNEASSYQAGLSALDAEQWQRAVDRFDQVIRIGKNRVDGAMYWKAYAQDKLGQRDEALATLQALEKSYPNSRYLDDARALQIEVKSSAGQSVRPEDQTTEDLKLMALNSVMQADPERGIPLLEQIIKGRNSLKVKERALLVLSTSDSPKARDVLASIARGGVNPDLQLKAIRYLGTRSRGSANAAPNGQMLADIYAASKDTDVKREVIRGLASARDVDRLLNIAKTETSPELRVEAIRQVGSMTGSRFAYVLGSSVTSSTYTLRSGSPVVVAPTVRDKTAPDTEAVREKTADALTQIYRTDKDQTVRKAIIAVLYSQQNAKALVNLARQESDPIMKKEIVSRLSTMKSKEATDYMLELLK